MTKTPEITKERIERVIDWLSGNSSVRHEEYEKLLADQISICQLALQAMNAKMPSSDEIRKEARDYAGSDAESTFIGAVQWIKERLLK
jgi:hypothetical protein